MRSSTSAIVLMLLVVTPIPARAEEDDFWGDFFQGFFVSEVVDAVAEATETPSKVSLREEAETSGDPPPPSILGGLLLIGVIALCIFLIVTGQFPWGLMAGIIFSALLKGARGRRH